jgi:hypothetical protein
VNCAAPPTCSTSCRPSSSATACCLTCLVSGHASAPGARRTAPAAHHVRPAVVGDATTVWLRRSQWEAARSAPACAAAVSCAWRVRRGVLWPSEVTALRAVRAVRTVASIDLARNRRTTAQSGPEALAPARPRDRVATLSTEGGPLGAIARASPGTVAFPSSRRPLAQTRRQVPQLSSIAWQ